MNPIKTDYLVSAGSLLIGAGTVMNLSGNYFQYNYSKNGEEADKCAIYRDWRIVGQVLEEVVESQHAPLPFIDPSQPELALG